MRQRLVFAKTLAVLFALAALSQPAGAKSVRLQLRGYEGATVLTNFQALVKLNEGQFGFSYGDFAANDGSDLWFAGADGNAIPHEIDTWNPSGDSFVWVRVPELKGKDTAIFMHWGEARTAEQIAPGNVWKNYGDGKGGFAGVWHMNADKADEPDAAGNGLTGVRIGSDTTTLDQMVRTSDGVVGRARVNQNGSYENKGNSLKVSGYGAYIADASRFTVSGWFRETATTKLWYRLFGSPKWEVYKNDGLESKVLIANVIQVNGSVNIADPAPDAFDSSENFVDNWCHVAIVFDGTSCRFYGNGRLLGSWDGKTAVDGVADFFKIGNAPNTSYRGWYGKYDEVRMYDGVQSADRVKADYDTMKSPDTFVVHVPDTTMGSVTLQEDTDWTELGLVAFTAGAVVDLNGYNLTYAGFGGFGGAAMVTNSVQGTVSRLTVKVSGTGNVNTGTAVGGDIRFVKEGSGTFTSAKALTYSGGTEVNAGTIQAPISTEAYDASFTPFGPGSITVRSNAVFNVQSTAAYANGVILAGGTIKGGVQNSSGLRPAVMLEGVTADSAIEHVAKGLEIGKTGIRTDICGHTIRVYIAADTFFRWKGDLEGVEGKIVATGDGYLNDEIHSRTVDLDVRSNVNLTGPSEVHDFRAANPDSAGAAGTMYGLNVYGVFTPVGDCWYGCILQDGATLDLSGREGVFSLSSSVAKRVAPGVTDEMNEVRRSVQFAAGTVTVKLAGRDDIKALAGNEEDNYILKWNAAYGRPAATDFVLDPATARKFTLRPDAEGLRLFIKKGLQLIVR